MATPQERLATALSDRYRIVRELGQGGMATVYLATDIRHDRQVAIKVLRPELAAVIGAERFLSEIRTTANLNHPNILPLFDSGEADSLLFYVMPYVQDESLRDRLDREKQLSVEDAVRIASEVASALDYAHRHGVIHRDIKPANVLFHDGRSLVADFGIALAASRAVGGRMTETGMSLGTPSYMSPEQAMGEREITARSDVYSLGAMTYEMLLGEPPFTGPTAQAIVAKVLTGDPAPLRKERKSIPPSVEDAVLTALEKLPADRFSSAAAFADALSGNEGTSGPRLASRRLARSKAGEARAPSDKSGRRSIAIGIAALALLAAGGAGWLLNSAMRKPAADLPVRMAFTLAQPAVDRPFIAISPDGRKIIQVAADSDGLRRIVMRELGSTDIKIIEGTDGAVDPEFSADGAWISFNAEGQLRKVPVFGGPFVKVVDSASVGGGAWTQDGQIVYTRDGRGLWIVPATGGATHQLTSLDTARKEFNHWYPQALPGGNAIIYTSYTTPISRARVEAYDFKTKKTKVLLEGGVHGKYTDGHLLYALDNAIFAVPFDPEKLEVYGTPVPVESDVDWTATDGLGAYAVSANGTLVYLKASEWNVERRVVWVDRSGKEEPAFPREGAFAEPRLSPDGRWIAITVTAPRREIWLYEVGRSVLSRLSRTDNAAFNAVWTPDSRSIVYSHEDPVYDIHRIPIDGSASDIPVVATAWDKYACAVSPDGRLLAYIENRVIDRIYVVPLDGSAKPRALSPNAIAQRGASFSPDGHSIAYEEVAHGRPNVFVTAAEGTSARRQVSVDGGEQPRWTRGGREIVFRKGEALMTAPVDAEGNVGKPVELFRKTQPDRLGVGRTYTYDVTADGNRFLLALPQYKAGAQPVIVVLNWLQELNAKSRRTR
ncbi:MAG TPA: protein kinase [Gemmatimonadaceae bacterium]|nr:protein kinase [Gemmatimonadaceae bacterium]